MINVADSKKKINKIPWDKNNNEQPRIRFVDLETFGLL